MQARRLTDGVRFAQRLIGADQFQIDGDAGRTRVDQRLGGALRQHVFGHGAVGGPLAAGHRDQPTAADQHRVLAAQALGVVALVVWRLDQRAQADPDTLDIRAFGRTTQITRRFGQNEINFFVERQRLARQVMAWRVGGAENHLAQPGHGKQDTAIGSFGHHQGGITTQKFTIHHHVHALTGCHHWFGGPPAIGTIGGAVFLAQLIDPNPGGVDDAARLDAVGLAAERVLTDQSGDFALLVKQIKRAAVVHQQRATRRRRAAQRQCQACVVELAVPVLDAALEPLWLRRGQQRQCLGAA